MPRPCKTCTDEDREAIEDALSSQSLALAARRFGISESSLQRHAAHHMQANRPGTKRESLNPNIVNLQGIQSLNLHLADLIEAVEQVREQAEADGDAKLILAAVHRHAELLKMTDARAREIELEEAVAKLSAQVMACIQMLHGVLRLDPDLALQLAPHLPADAAGRDIAGALIDLRERYATGKDS